MSLAKKTFVLRINDETFSALARWAEDEFRSVNGQIEMILDKALKDAGRKKEKSSNNNTTAKSLVKNKN
ncbi:MAG: Arc family DNA binding domain-containing protein [Bacteroidetes bacterium]|nr:Arc family DNA binding domain-containing protein [Bacteroidota bacterium]